MPIATHIEATMEKSSWIRKMFEEGARLKAQHGAQNVFDFSLGNPNLPPPARFEQILQEVVAHTGPGDHGYMPNTGYAFTRAAVAEYLSRQQGVELNADDLVMTCGAAGALNIVLKTILNPDDEVITPTPCFVEYGFYASNHGGKIVLATTHDDFTLDLDAIEQAITPRTRAVLINSPNNPTGQVYNRESLEALGSLLERRGGIYLIADEPYRKIVYDNIPVPGILACCRNSVVVSSYSKDLSIPGERLGYAAVNPQADDHGKLLAGMALANRILGFVNAPALMQRVVAQLQEETVDVAVYQRKRDLLCDGLADAGYAIAKPAGAFYLFPKSPIADDVRFVQALQEELVLAVPGSGFMGPGHFRIAYCVDDDTIVNALPGFRRALRRFVR